MKTSVLIALGGVALACLLAMSCGREAPVGTLKVDSSPPGLMISVNPVGSASKTSPSELPTTPFTRVLSTGQYVITPIYEQNDLQVTPSERTIVITAAQLLEISFTTARLGVISVTSTPSAAKIWVDGEDSGLITPSDLTLTEGDHVIEVRLDGFVLDGSPETVTIDPDNLIDLSQTLLRSGFLNVTSTPDGAEILIDEISTGQATPALLEIAAGTHVVSLVRAGWISSPVSMDINVPEGDTATADFILVAEGTTGDLTVTSLPAGADIMIDGAPTGEVTPFTFALPPVAHTISLHRAGFHDSDDINVTPVPGSTTTEHVILAANKIALIETISGINCVGCPAMNTVLLNMENSGFGVETMLSIKYSGPFGGPDHHFDANSTVLQNRMTVYANNTIWNWAAPTLFLDGSIAVAPANNGYPGFGDLTIMLTESADDDPGFAIDVHVADWNADPLIVTVDLIPTREINHSGAVLNLAVVENPIHYDEPQNDYGEDEFHWVCREFAQIDDAPLPISPASPGHFEIQVPKQANWTGFDTTNLSAIVFVQDESTLEVLQAGAQISGGHLATSMSSMWSSTSREQ
jgi:hypothetical protein